MHLGNHLSMLVDYNQRFVFDLMQFIILMQLRELFNVLLTAIITISKLHE